MVAICNERFMPKVTNDIKREEKNVAFHAFLFATCNNLRYIEETTVEILMSSFMRSSH